MDWKEWIGRNIFVRLKTGKVYSGVVEKVDDDSKPLIFIYITDKYGNKVMFVHSEIIEIKEEKRDGRTY